MSKVYILLDSDNRITNLDGGYSISNVDVDTWILIDEGEGDKYNLCQSHYLDMPLIADDGTHNYIYENDAIREATPAEHEEEFNSFPVIPPTPSAEDQIAELNATLDMLLTEVIPSLFG